ncbi:Rieske (2Fe-2S) protein [Phenylobacterium hankyongense]|uniref:Rieske (2Fe-2S) protein n=1 Tax=Phenylobacterium hankyongense TaxID=1813876 RepID=A0A328AY83_9CAUL|nr:Rieske (2Fe-2S) protein [Phenylobacterium hankyongense]
MASAPPLATSSSPNPAQPEAGVRLCDLAEIADPGAKSFRFRVDSRLFAGFVVRAGDTVAGYVDSCPHAGWPLGAMDDRYLTRSGEHILCAGHGALFRLDGTCVAGPCVGERLYDWPVALRGGTLFTA